MLDMCRTRNPEGKNAEENSSLETTDMVRDLNNHEVLGTQRLGLKPHQGGRALVNTQPFS